MGSSKAFLQILVDHQKATRPPTHAPTSSAPKQKQTEATRWWHRSNAALEGIVDPYGAANLQISGWITKSGAGAPIDPGLPNPHSRNYGTRHLSRLYRTTPPSPQLQEQQVSAQQQKIRVIATPAVDVISGVQPEVGPSISQDAQKNIIAARRPGFRPRPIKVTDTRELEPPSCPICINPLMQAREVVATACGSVPPLRVTACLKLTQQRRSQTCLLLKVLAAELHSLRQFVPYIWHLRGSGLR